MAESSYKNKDVLMAVQRMMALPNLYAFVATNIDQ